MARVLIIYHSKTGNTEAMSEAVEEGVKKEGVEVIRKRLEEASIHELPQFDGIIIGSPTYFAAATAEVKRFIDDSIKYYRQLCGKVGAAFVSSGGLGGGGETALISILQGFLTHGMVVPGYTGGGHYGPVSIGAPDEEKKKACQEMGTIVARLVKKLFD